MQSKFDHHSAQEGDAFYYLKFLYTFPCNALYRTVSSNPHGDKNVFLKMEGCILSGMSKKARECLAQMKAPLDPKILDSDQIILNNCFSNAVVIKEKELVQQKVKKIPDMSRYLQFVQQFEPLPNDVATFQRTQTTCKTEQEKLQQCLSSKSPWECYKENVQFYLCYKTGYCHNELKNCMERTKHLKEDSERYLFCLENDRKVKKCYKDATNAQTQQELLQQAQPTLDAALKKNPSFNGASCSKEEFSKTFKEYHSTLCKQRVEALQACKNSQRGDCADEEIWLNFCLLTSLCANPLKQCMNKGKSFQQCSMEDEQVFQCVDRTEDPELIKM